MVKNIHEERQCPDQILLGSMDIDFCVLLGLSIYLEVWIKRGHAAAGEKAFLFTDNSNEMSGPRSANKRYREILKSIFQSNDFKAIAITVGGIIGSHSIRKFAATFAKAMGCSLDQVDTRGRWKTRKSGRVVDAYVSPEQATIH